ncbi:MAG: transporter [Planctomycetota bacterium]
MSLATVYTLDVYDYLMIAGYFAFMLLIGVVFSRTSKDTSDYLRGGGTMTWWMTGASSFMITFSAWTFVGAAGEIYRTGTLIISLFAFNVIANVLVGLFLAHRFRRMRVITPVDAVRQRFGAGTEQIYAWQSSLFAFLFGGIALYTVAIFIAPLLGLNLATTILILGAVITFMSVTGGAWAVVASDFVQMLVIMAVTVVAAVLVLNMPEVGGVSGMIRQMPSYHLDWTELMRPQVVGLWLVGIFINQIASSINLIAGASRYLYVKSDRDAKRAAYMVALGFLVGPVVWFIPPIAASFVIPNIAAQFPQLTVPEEASYAAMCMLVFPSGMIGLLACGIFAATMSAMDSGLNRNAGILVRNIYKPLVRPGATETEMLWIARGVTLLLGISMTLIGVWFSAINQMPMFDWTLLVAGLISIPMTMPLVLGMFTKRTPGWTAWSTIVVGLLTAYLMRYHVRMDAVARAMGVPLPLSNDERGDLQFACMVVGVSVVTTVWFLASRRFYRPPSPKRQAEADAFFTNLNTPVTAPAKAFVQSDAMQFRVLGLLCLSYGGFILAGVLIPNDLSGRLCFLFVGGLLIAVGGLLYGLYRRARKRSRVETNTEDASPPG